MSLLLSLSAAARPCVASAQGASDYSSGEELCRVALSGCVKETQAASKLSDEKDSLLKYDKEQIERLEKEKNSIFRSPLLWVTVGIVTGVVIRGK